MLRVLHIVPNMHAAGLETLIMNLYRNMDREQIQFDFLTHYPGKYFYDDEIEALGGHIYRLTFREDGNFGKYLRDLDNFFRTHRDYQIVHSHMASTSFFTLRAAKKYGVPVRIIHSHNTSTENTLKGRLKHLMLTQSARYANHFFACGVSAGNYLFHGKSFYVVHNAIDLEKFKNASAPTPDKLPKALQDKFIIGHIGRFNTQKNHIFLLDVFEKFHEANLDSVLVLVGEGELEQTIRASVTKRNLNDAVFFLGVRNDAHCLYKLFDVFVLPSLFEGLPVVGIECQAAGIRSIMSDKITDEVKLTNYVEFAPIDMGVAPWVSALEKIKTTRGSINEEEEYKKLFNAGYDIKSEANLLLQKYQQCLGQ